MNDVSAINSTAPVVSQTSAASAPALKTEQAPPPPPAKDSVEISQSARDAQESTSQDSGTAKDTFDSLS